MSETKSFNHGEEEEGSRFVPREVLVRMEILSILGVTILLIVLAILRPAPLGPSLDPLQTPVHVSAPWIFAGIQELLRYLSPLIAGVVIPLVLYLLFMFLPFLPGAATEEGVRTLGKRRGLLFVFVFLCLCLAVPTFLHFVR